MSHVAPTDELEVTLTVSGAKIEDQKRKRKISKEAPPLKHLRDIGFLGIITEIPLALEFEISEFLHGIYSHMALLPRVSNTIQSHFIETPLDLRIFAFIDKEQLFATLNAYQWKRQEMEYEESQISEIFLDSETNHSLIQNIANLTLPPALRMLTLDVKNYQTNKNNEIATIHFPNHLLQFSLSYVSNPCVLWQFPNDTLWLRNLEDCTINDATNMEILDMVFLKDCKNLKSVHFDSCGIVLLQNIESLPQNVESLDFNGNKINNACIIAITRLPKQLKKLYLYDNRITNIDSLVKVLDLCKFMETLDVWDGNDIENKEELQKSTANWLFSPAQDWF